MMNGRLTKTMKIFFFFFSINSILNVHCKSKVLVMQTSHRHFIFLCFICIKCMNEY